MLQNIIVFILLCTTAVVTIMLKKLDTKAAVAAVVIGFAVWLGEGYTGIVLLATFFVTGTLATSWKMHTKQQGGLAEQHRGQRSADHPPAFRGASGGRRRDRAIHRARIAHHRPSSPAVRNLQGH